MKYLCKLRISFHKLKIEAGHFFLLKCLVMKEYVLNAHMGTGVEVSEQGALCVAPTFIGKNTEKLNIFSMEAIHDSKRL